MKHLGKKGMDFRGLMIIICIPIIGILIMIFSWGMDNDAFGHEAKVIEEDTRLIDFDSYLSQMTAIPLIAERSVTTVSERFRELIGQKYHINPSGVLIALRDPCIMKPNGVYCYARISTQSEVADVLVSEYNKKAYVAAPDGTLFTVELHLGVVV